MPAKKTSANANETDQTKHQVVTSAPLTPVAKPVKKTLSKSTVKKTVHKPKTVRSVKTASPPETAPTAPPQLEAVTDNNPMQHRPYRNRARLVAIIILIAILALAALVWRQQRSNNTSEQTSANRSLVAEIAQRAVLPKDETPTVTTVVDKSKANQSFLADAVNGDKVLLYFQSGRAVLYRPSTHQVVNIGPLQQPPARVFLRDGTSGDIPANLRTSLSPQAGFNVLSQDTAAKQDYKQTLVIDVAGNRPDLATRAARLVGGKVANLPAGESRPDADILIIVGSDSK